VMLRPACSYSPLGWTSTGLVGAPGRTAFSTTPATHPKGRRRCGGPTSDGRRAWPYSSCGRHSSPQWSRWSMDGGLLTGPPVSARRTRPRGESPRSNSLEAHPPSIPREPMALSFPSFFRRRLCYQRLLPRYPKLCNSSLSTTNPVPPHDLFGRTAAATGGNPVCAKGTCLHTPHEPSEAASRSEETGLGRACFRDGASRSAPPCGRRLGSTPASSPPSPAVLLRSVAWLLPPPTYHSKVHTSSTGASDPPIDGDGG
jgi:hypothetical protein